MRTLPLFVVLAVTLAITLHAQQQPISLDVVVTDKSGKAIPSLTLQDFTILQDKKPAKILNFEAHGGPGVAPSESHTQIYLVIDAVNTTHSKVVNEVDEIKRFLRQNNGALTYPISLALFTDSGIQVQTEPSSDGNGLAAALDQNTPGFRAIGEGTGFYGAEEQLKRSLDALNTLVNRAGGTAGRKMVLWVSPGWPLLNSAALQLSSNQSQSIYESVVKLSRNMRVDSMTLYSIDPLRSDFTPQHSVLYQNFTKGLTRPGKAEVGDLGLQVLVTQTGGRAIFGDTPISTSLNRCVADLSAFYTLTIAPAPAEHSHEYHDLAVKMANPSLTARTRTGYYAEP